MAIGRMMAVVKIPHHLVYLLEQLGMYKEKKLLHVENCLVLFIILGHKINSCHYGRKKHFQCCENNVASICLTVVFSLNYNTAPFCY